MNDGASQIHPIKTTRLDHVEARSTGLGSLDLATRTHFRPTTDFAIDPHVSFRVPTTHDGRDSERTDAVVQSISLNVLTESIGKGLGWDRVLVNVTPAGRLISGPRHKVTAIGDEPGAGNADMPVHRGYLPIHTWLEELAGDKLFRRQYDTVLAANSYRCTSILHGLDRIFDLVK
jgi:hypothetical protein